MIGESPREGSSSRSKLGTGHQAPADRQHLLFPSAEGPGQLLPPLLQNREIGVHPFDPLTDRLLGSRG